MRKLEINITKAVLKSFIVSMPDEKGKPPEITASIGLLTDGGKEIADYTISTNSWRDEDKFDLPMRAFAPMAEVAKILEQVVVKHCNEGQKTIAASEDDKPIDLSEVPF